MPHVHVDGASFTPGQQRLWNSAHPLVLLSGGYGAGKTQGLATKLLQLKAANPGVPGLVLAPTWRTMWAVTYRRIWQTLRKCLPKADMPKLRDRNAECYLDFGDNVPVFLRSATNPDSFDGLDVGWLVGDEARYWPEHSWHVAQGRVRVKCPLSQVALVSTPAMGWLSNEFDSGRPNRELIVAPTSENAHNLAPGFIENLKESYSARLWRALIEGIFTILEGAVYEAFDPRRAGPWILHEDIQPDSTWLHNRKVYLAADPGFRRSAWIFIAENDDASWVVVDQLMLDQHSDAMAVREINSRGWPIDEIWCDPAAGATQSYEGQSTLKMLQLVKARRPRPMRLIAGANREIPFGVDKLRTLLGNPDANQTIRLRFLARLLDYERRRERGIVKDLAAYQYPPHKRGQAISEHPLKDGVSDHGCDAIRYWAVGRWLTDRRLLALDATMAQRQGTGFTVAA